MHKPYFPGPTDHPDPLRAVCSRRVRFEEVDPLGIVWHGRYPGYFEDARVALGDKYGIGYLDFYKHGVVAPIKKMHVDYLLPLYFDEIFTVEGIQYYSESARINTEYVIRNASGQMTTRGYTVQMFLGRDRKTLIAFPPFFETFCASWKRGDLCDTASPKITA